MPRVGTLRLGSQILFFGIIVYLGYLGVRTIEWHKIMLTLPTLSCYYTDHRVAQCFLRALQEGFSNGWKIAYVGLIAPVACFLVLGILFGRSWCSWVCPVGFVQDIFIRIRKSLKIGYYNLSDNLKVSAVFVKWFLVIALICVSAGIGIPHFFLKEYQYELQTPFCQICPGKQIFTCVAPKIIKGEPVPKCFSWRFKEMLPMDNILHPLDSMYTPLATTMSYLVLFVFAFYLFTTSFIRRMWCRLCPISALLGSLSRFSFLSLRKEGPRCTKCGICYRCCPVQVKEVYEEKVKERIAQSDCTLCFRCVEMCPEKDALKIAFLKRPIATSKFRRFMHAGAVRAPKSKKEKTR